MSRRHWTAVEIELASALTRLGASGADILEALAAIGSVRPLDGISRQMYSRLGQRPCARTRRGDYRDAHHAAALAALRDGPLSGDALTERLLAVPAAPPPPPPAPPAPPSLPPERLAFFQARQAHAQLIARHLARTCPWAGRPATEVHP